VHHLPCLEPFVQLDAVPVGLPRWLLQHIVQLCLPGLWACVRHLRRQLDDVHRLPRQHVSLRHHLLLDLPCRYHRQRQQLCSLHQPLLGLLDVGDHVHCMHHGQVPLQQPVPVRLPQRHVPPGHRLRRMHVPLRQLHGIGDHLLLVRGHVQLLPSHVPVLLDLPHRHVCVFILGHVGVQQLHRALQHVRVLCLIVHRLCRRHIPLRVPVCFHLSPGHLPVLVWRRPVPRVHLAVRQLQLCLRVQLHQLH